MRRAPQALHIVNIHRYIRVRQTDMLENQNRFFRACLNCSCPIVTFVTMGNDG
jgi:hypothetical protein